MNAAATITRARKCGPSGTLVQADGLTWNVVSQGEGPVILLVHGTAASTHSWRHVMPLLAADHHVIAVDLPGHGRTSSRGSRDLNLDRMARGLGALMTALHVEPAVVAGHSAGAAVLVHANARSYLRSDRLVSFNGAFFPFSGVAGSLFSPIAKLVALNPLVPRILTSVASRSTVERLLRDTGSKPSADDVDCYYELFRQPSHVAAALGMMAAWDLTAMATTLAHVVSDSLFVGGNDDKAVPPDTADKAARLCPRAQVLSVKGHGHLLHECEPALAAHLIAGRRQAD